MKKMTTNRRPWLMKKILCIFISLLFVFGLSACGEVKDDKNKDDTPTSEKEEPKEEPVIEKKEGSLYIRYNQNNDKNE